MTPSGADRFDKPWLLLCEGVGDQRFFEKLFEAHNIADFNVRFPHREGKWNGGRLAFGNDLGVIAVNEDFIEKVQAILVVSDNDDDPPASFKAVQNELHKVNGLPVPDKEQIVARGKPHVVILMLPMAKKGNLETLCLEAAHTKWGLKTELDSFVASTPANAWELSKQSKMRMQTMLASTNSHQPDCGFASHWKQDEQFRIPVNDAAFTDLVTFLRGFPALVA